MTRKTSSNLSPAWCLFTLWVISLALAPLALAQTESATPPNIIIILVDDLGVGSVQYSETAIRESYPVTAKSYGKTPNLAKMAQEGVVLTSFYVPSPVCSPSRAALLTGRFQRYSGIEDIINPDDKINGLRAAETTIAKILKERASYATGVVGKWHLGTTWTDYLPYSHGFDYFYGSEFALGVNPGGFCLADGDKRAEYFVMGPGFTAPGGSNPYSAAFEKNHVCPDGDPDKPYNEFLKEAKMSSTDVEKYDTVTDVLTSKAIKFIEKYYSTPTNGNDPFFLYLAYTAPHWSHIYHWDTDCMARLAKDSLIVGTCADNDQQCLINEYCQGHDNKPNCYSVNGSNSVSSQNAVYNCVLEDLDENIGRLLATLDNLADSNRQTAVFFLSDNGAEFAGDLSHSGNGSTKVPDLSDDPAATRYPYDAGKELKGAKRYTTEGGVRVPFIARYKGHFPKEKKDKRYRASDIAASSMDLFPTILSMAGLPNDQSTLPRTVTIRDENDTEIIKSDDTRGQDITSLLENPEAPGSYTDAGRSFHFHYPAAAIYAGNSKPGFMVPDHHYAVRWKEDENSIYKFFASDGWNYNGSYEFNSFKESYLTALRHPVYIGDETSKITDVGYDYLRANLENRLLALHGYFNITFHPHALYFPHIHDGVNGWMNFLTVQALDPSEPVTITVTLYNSDGSLAPRDETLCSSCRNPEIIMVSPYKKFNATPNWLLYGMLQNKLFEGTVVVRANKPIIGMTEAMGPDKETFAIYRAVEEPSETLFFTTFHDGAVTVDGLKGEWVCDLHIQNVENDSVTVTIDANNPDGTLAGQLLNQVIPAHGKFSVRPSGITASKPFLGTVKVAASGGKITGAVKYSHGTGLETESFSVYTANKQSAKSYLPMLYDGFSGNHNYISILNTNPTSVEVTMDLFDEGGTLVYRHQEALDQYKKINTTPSLLMCGSTGCAHFAGTAIISATAPVYASTNTISPSAQGPRDTFTIYEAVAAQDIAEAITILFPQTNNHYQQSPWENSLFIQNVDGKPHVVTIKYYNADGSLVIMTPKHP